MLAQSKRVAETDESSRDESWNQEDELGFCEDLFTVVMTATDDTNRPLHLVFQLLPSKKVSTVKAYLCGLTGTGSDPDK